MENSLVDVLTVMAQGMGVGAVIAFLFENVKWFQGLEASVKWWLILGLSVGLPLGAQLLVQLVPGDVWAMLEPFWQAIAAGFLVWAGSQGTHVLFNRYLAARTIVYDELSVMAEPIEE